MDDFLSFLLAILLIVATIAGSIYIGFRTARPYSRIFNVGTQVDRLFRIRKLVLVVFLIDLALLPLVVVSVALGLPSFVLIFYFAVLAPAAVGALTVHVGTREAIRRRADTDSSDRHP